MRNELGSWREVGGGRCTRRAAMRGRRLRIAWQEDEGTLWQRYRGEPDPELRTRWHALGLLRQGRSATAAAALVGVHRGSVQRWLAWYRRGGLAAVAQHRQGGRQGRAAHLTAAQHAPLKAETAQGPITAAGVTQQTALTCGDELRVGWCGQVRRVWAPRGVKVRQRVQWRRAWRYLALAVDGLQGTLRWCGSSSMPGAAIAEAVPAWEGQGGGAGG